MSKFQELYNADIARYGGKPELYIKYSSSFIARPQQHHLLLQNFYTKLYSDSGRIAEAWK